MTDEKARIVTANISERVKELYKIFEQEHLNHVSLHFHIGQGGNINVCLDDGEEEKWTTYYLPQEARIEIIPKDPLKVFGGE